jgi:hypothetical protein
LKESVHTYEKNEKIFNMDRAKENFGSNVKTNSSTIVNTNSTNDNEFNLISFSNQIDNDSDS